MPGELAQRPGARWAQFCPGPTEAGTPQEAAVLAAPGPRKGGGRAESSGHDGRAGHSGLFGGARGHVHAHTACRGRGKRQGLFRTHLVRCRRLCGARWKAPKAAGGLGAARSAGRGGRAWAAVAPQLRRGRKSAQQPCPVRRRRGAGALGAGPGAGLRTRRAPRARSGRGRG